MELNLEDNQSQSEDEPTMTGGKEDPAENCERRGEGLGGPENRRHAFGL